MMPRAHFPTDESYLVYLRDWFAGQALDAVVRDVLADAAMMRKRPSELPGVMAKAAYQVADAMLAARTGR